MLKKQLFIRKIVYHLPSLSGSDKILLWPFRKPFFDRFLPWPHEVPFVRDLSLTLRSKVGVERYFRCPRSNQCCTPSRACSWNYGQWNDHGLLAGRTYPRVGRWRITPLYLMPYRQIIGAYPQIQYRIGARYAWLPHIMADSSEHNRFKYGCRIPAKRGILTAQRQNNTRIKVKR